MKYTHTVVLQFHDGSTDTLKVRETARSWISNRGNIYDKRTGTRRTPWATSKLLFDTLKPIEGEA